MRTSDNMYYVNFGVGKAEKRNRRKGYLVSRIGYQEARMALSPNIVRFHYDMPLYTYVLPKNGQGRGGGGHPPPWVCGDALTPQMAET